MIKKSTRKGVYQNLGLVVVYFIKIHINLYLVLFILISAWDRKRCEHTERYYFDLCTPFAGQNPQHLGLFINYVTQKWYGFGISPGNRIKTIYKL